MVSPVFGGSKNHAPALVCRMLNAAAELAPNTVEAGHQEHRVNYSHPNQIVLLKFSPRNNNKGTKA